MVGMVPIHSEKHMRYISFTILLASISTCAAETPAQYLANAGVGNPMAYVGNLYGNELVPVAPPFGPALPIPQGRYAGPWGTGYSVVTTERESTDWLRKSLGDPNHTYKRTVTSILPNDALGQPMQGPSLNFLP
jgi:hypothetical protein